MRIQKLMPKNNFLEVLPSNYRHEKKFFLSKGNFSNWNKLSQITDSNINKIIHDHPLCTESRLKKIRAISKLIIDLDISPGHAYILLHSGITSMKALSILDPYTLERKIGRLNRKLNITLSSNIDSQLLKSWILKAKKYS